MTDAPCVRQWRAAYRCRVSAELLQRAASSGAWLTAVLRGTVGVEQALDVLSTDGEPPLFLTSGENEPLTLPFAVARWRQLGVLGWIYLPVAPGDAARLPGPDHIRRRSPRPRSRTGCVGEPLIGLIPDGDEDGIWGEYPTSGPARGYVDSPAEADRSLLEELNVGVAALDGNDLASWRRTLDELRGQWAVAEPMPPGTDPRSERLALRSRRILELLEAAGTDDDGGSRTAAEMAIRRSALADLSRAARHAHAVAWNTGLRRPPKAG